MDKQLAGITREEVGVAVVPHSRRLSYVAGPDAFQAFFRMAVGVCGCGDDYRRLELGGRPPTTEDCHIWPSVSGWSALKADFSAPSQRTGVGPGLTHRSGRLGMARAPSGVSELVCPHAPCIWEEGIHPSEDNAG